MFALESIIKLALVPSGRQNISTLGSDNRLSHFAARELRLDESELEQSLSRVSYKMLSIMRMLATSRKPGAAPGPSFLELPVELRNRIYAFALLTEKPWIGAMSTVSWDVSHDAAARDDGRTPKETGLRPSAFIRTTTSATRVCRQIRNEYREVVWWHYLHRLEPDAYIEVYVQDFCVDDIRQFIACCSDAELRKLNEQRPGPKRYRLRIHLDVEREFPIWTCLRDERNFKVAFVVYLGNLLVSLLERLGFTVMIPRRLLEL